MEKTLSALSSTRLMNCVFLLHIPIKFKEYDPAILGWYFRNAIITHAQHTEKSMSKLFPTKYIFPSLHKTWKFITVLTKLCHWILSQATWNEPIPSYHFSVILTTHKFPHSLELSDKNSLRNFHFHHACY
jgi:hypothetical protein